MTLVHADRNTPGFMRSPPVVPYIYALESAMDELAVALDMDPVELRRVNELDARHHRQGMVVSLADDMLRPGGRSVRLVKREAKPGAMRDGDWLVGWGCATAIYPTHIGASTVRVRLVADGEAHVQIAAHEIGTGAYTVDRPDGGGATGHAASHVSVEIGDSRFPAAPVAGGSNTTASCCNGRDQGLRRHPGQARAANATTGSDGPAPAAIQGRNSSASASAPSRNTPNSCRRKASPRRWPALPGKPYLGGGSKGQN